MNDTYITTEKNKLVFMRVYSFFLIFISCISQISSFLEHFYVCNIVHRHFALNKTTLLIIDFYLRTNMTSSNITILQLEANEFHYISMMFIRCYCYLIMPLGTVGHLLNIYVFTRPSLRSNPCVMYFLAATVFGFLIVCHNLPVRLIQVGYTDMDPSAYSILFCKIDFFLIATIR